ncbi:hypothetical protein ACCC92_05815 [Mucilaginibacter sp. Mucisp84]|uniref:hypothetical protein n=1 Tax=Mucilaginibacter sp. Mucisp84 TaxID=3243058 RepID=UPI0039A671B3
MENICQIISFSDAVKIIKELQFVDVEDAVDNFINERQIFLTAKRLGKEVKFWPIPNWDEFEMGEVDISPIQLVECCFKGLKYQNEKLLIITMESYTTQKVFLVDFIYYKEFADSYERHIGYNIDFVQPADYIFFLLNQRTVVYINNEGLYTQIKFD